MVAFGGGTGLPMLLGGLRDFDGGHLTAVVSVADDGGSSGRLRQELGIAPPGDVRRCLVALAERRRLAEVFEYRFESGAELHDHSVGNLIIAALADMSGGFSAGVERAGRFLRIKGVVLPAATESLTLVVHHTDGSVTRGESTSREHSGSVARVAVEPDTAPAPPGVIAAIERADVVVLSPGSLYTSTIPSLLGGGTAEALTAFHGPVVYAANLMTQPGETLGFSVSDHLQAIRDHVGPVVTDVLVNSVAVPEAVAAAVSRRRGGPGGPRPRGDRARRASASTPRRCWTRRRARRHATIPAAWRPCCASWRTRPPPTRGQLFAAPLRRKKLDPPCAPLRRSVPSRSPSRSTSSSVVTTRSASASASSVRVVGAGDPERRHAARLGGLHPGHGVLDHEAVRGRLAELGRRGEKDLRVRLALREVAPGDVRVEVVEQRSARARGSRGNPVLLGEGVEPDLAQEQLGVLGRGGRRHPDARVLDGDDEPQRVGDRR